MQENSLIEPYNLTMSPQRKYGGGDADISVYISLNSQKKIQSSHIRSINISYSQHGAANIQCHDHEASSAMPTVSALTKKHISKSKD